jgi:hypothetical protein
VYYGKSYVVFIGEINSKQCRIVSLPLEGGDLRCLSNSAESQVIKQGGANMVEEKIIIYGKAG